MISKNKIFLLLFCLFFLFANFCFVGATNGAQEDDSAEVKFYPQIGIPGSDFNVGDKVLIDGGSFINYLSAIYKWSVGAIAIIAVVMIMIAGFQWMAAAGNASAIGQAKSRISSSLIGLLLAIGAYSILNFVNPSLVYLRTLGIGDIDYVELHLSKKKCDVVSNNIVYDWSHHYNCFHLRDNDVLSSDSFVATDMGIADTIEEGDIDDITITLAVREDQISGKNCDVKNDFAAFGRLHGKKKDFNLKADTTCKSDYQNVNSWSACLPSGKVNEEVNPDSDLLEYINKDGDIVIRAQAVFNSIHQLTSIDVQAASKDGNASALFTGIKINTNTSCWRCCYDQVKNKSFFGSTISCDPGEKEVALSECCKESHYNKPCGYQLKDSCVPVEKFCGRCHWSQSDFQCE